jgi:hypothetical protein
MADCNNPNEVPVTTYTPPALCTPGMRLQDDSDCGKNDSTYAEKVAAEALEIAGVGINVFKLLGVHEQGKLIDLTGTGYPISSGTAAGSNIGSAFDTSIGTIWRSSVLGADVLSAPAYLGYYFGIKKTSTGVSRYGRPQFETQNISTIMIKQSANPLRRVTRIRLDWADGSLHATHPDYLGTGNGELSNVIPGYWGVPGVITLIATSPTQFSVIHSGVGPLGTASVSSRFNHMAVSFNVRSGSIPFAIGDMFMFETELHWHRAGIQNVPDTANLESISFQSSVPAAYWRIVPVLFNGSADPTQPWEVDELQMMDYQQTNIDNVQDFFFQENRDRDYANCSLQLRAQYTPFDSLGDLGKFGMSILDQYVFTVSFARMVEVLGRPVLVGDILEVPSEMQWDHNMKPVKKFLEVTDTGWSSEGYTPGWRPILWRFQASQLIPAQENRDILGTVDSYLSKSSDQTFFDQFDKQIETLGHITTEENAETTHDESPEQGQDSSTIATGNALLGPLAPEIYDNHDQYLEDGLPPEGKPYTEGYDHLPDVATAHDGDYFRLNYPPDTGIPSRLYKFNGIKMRWLYCETDRRMESSSHKKSVRKVFLEGTQSLKG